MLPVLFIGRFQPFHLGHLDAIRQVLSSHDKIIIGIGSAQYSGKQKNPYPVNMRQKMIQESLRDARISGERFSIVHIPDIHNDDEWVAHVEKLCPPFGAVLSGTPLVQDLFRKNGTHEVMTPQFNFHISGTAVREKMADKEPWEEMVPEVVAGIIHKNT